MESDIPLELASVQSKNRKNVTLRLQESPDITLLEAEQREHIRVLLPQS
jgi:hypothetical protein